VTEWRFDWRMERRAPSWEFIVFCRDTGANEEEDEVEALEGACSVATDMSARKVPASSGKGQPLAAGSITPSQGCAAGRSVKRERAEIK
jgi:hypothetical protein